jgi:hypothetical protein
VAAVQQRLSLPAHPKPVKPDLANQPAHNNPAMSTAARPAPPAS